jgi:osomolarity two-component system sensor histidine kinase NIK1
MKADAGGDLTKKIEVDVRGEILELKETVNGMTESLSVFADKVTTVAGEVGMEGELEGQARVAKDDEDEDGNTSCSWRRTTTTTTAATTSCSWRRTRTRTATHAEREMAPTLVSFRVRRLSLPYHTQHRTQNDTNIGIVQRSVSFILTTDAEHETTRWCCFMLGSSSIPSNVL